MLVDSMFVHCDFFCLRGMYIHNVDQVEASQCEYAYSLFR